MLTFVELHDDCHNRKVTLNLWHVISVEARSADASESGSTIITSDGGARHVRESYEAITSKAMGMA